MLGKMPTPDDIISGPYEDNTIVHACVDAWKRGEYSWEQALMAAVLELCRSEEATNEIAATNPTSVHPELMTDDQLVEFVTDEE